MKNLPAIIGLFICLTPPLVSTANAAQQSNSKGFAQLCQEKESLSVSIQKTINSLLDQVETVNCKTAESKLKKMTKLTLSNSGINDIRPLAGLTGLTEIDLSSNQIVDISPLANLKKLKTLNLDNNKISNISALSGLTNLNTLTLVANRITSVKPLATLSELKMLSLIGNKVTDIQPLAKLKKLKFVALSNNPIKNKVCPIKPTSVCVWNYE
jgi:internalin A